jgi:hypothetical protein
MQSITINDTRAAQIIAFLGLSKIRFYVMSEREEEEEKHSLSLSLEVISCSPN